jgi:hypothetical protein
VPKVEKIRSLKLRIPKGLLRPVVEKLFDSFGFIVKPSSGLPITRTINENVTASKVMRSHSLFIQVS